MLTEEQIRKYTKSRIAAAQVAVQHAQDALGTACSMLSALQYGNPTYQKGHKLYDQVHAFWYKIDDLYHNPKVRLDPLNIEAIEKQLDDGAHRPPQP